eukprot:g9118.t1
MPETVTAPLRRMLGAEETRSENMEERVFCEDLDPLQSAKASKKVTTQAYDEDDERHVCGALRGFDRSWEALRIEEFPSPLVRGDVLEGTSRAKVMKWSFRDRLDLLDQSFYDYDFRDAVYLRREEDADEDTKTCPDGGLVVLGIGGMEELADLFIQAIQKRSDRPLCKATEDHLGLISAIEDFVAGESGRLAIVTHVPGACDAARQLFYGPQVLSGTTDVSLPVKGEVCLEPYLPLFRLADPGRREERRDTLTSAPRRMRVEDSEASKPTELAEEDQKHRYAEGIRTMPVPDGPPASLPTPPGAPRFAGRECRGFDDFLDPDLETNDKEVEAEVKATIGKEYRALLKWREAEPWKKMVKTRTKKNVGNFHMHEKLTSLDEAVDFDDMAGWPVLRGTFMEKDLQHDPILFARRAQDAMDAQMRTEHALRLEGKLVESNTAKKRFEHFVEEDELMEPIMVCFPPPGIVPIEMVCEAEMMPWTISPDPYRLSLGSPSSPVAIFVGQRTAYGVDLGQQSLVRSHGFQKNSSVGAWLEKNLQEKALVAILNWVGVRPTPSCEPLRLCSTISDARGTKPSLESHIRENLKLSSTVHRYAAQFLAEHQLQSYNAVQMRAEMVLHHRYLSASCNDSGVYTWFSSLKELFSNKETWFRARDLKKGGSSTLQWFDNQSRNTLMRLEAEVWQSSPATFLDYDCTSLSPVMCLLVDVALLSGAERLVRLDTQAHTAQRLSEVPLMNFCVDSTNSLGFCVIFTPKVQVVAGDEFEVVLTGLRDQHTPMGAVCNLQYFLSFQSFGRHHQDQDSLSLRAASWLTKLQTPSIWEEVAFTSGSEQSDRGVDERLGSAKRARALSEMDIVLRHGLLAPFAAHWPPWCWEDAADERGPDSTAARSVHGGRTQRVAELRCSDRPSFDRRRSKRSPRYASLGRSGLWPPLWVPVLAVGVSRGRRTPRRADERSRKRSESEKLDHLVQKLCLKGGRLVQLRFEEVKTAPVSFDQKRPPPLGVVKHPKGERTRQGYHVEVTGNEIMLSLIHPSSIVIKATLSCFLKSQAKWEGISHGAPKQVSRRPVANEADQWVSDFVEAVPQLRVFPTEETIGSEWLGAETDELQSFWQRCALLEKARVVLALKERLESSPRDSWQVQARMLRVILSAFQQPFLGRISSAALTGRAQELLKQFRSSEVLELREEAAAWLHGYAYWMIIWMSTQARLWQLLELSWSMPNENPWRLALQGGLLAFTENAKAAPPEARRTEVKDVKATSLTSGAERGAEDLLDLRPWQIGAAASSVAQGGPFTAQSTAQNGSADRRALPRAGACGPQHDLERMYSFARPAPKHIPYFPPSTQVKMLTEQDPFDFVSEQLDVLAACEARHKRQSRVVLTVMLPTCGQYELRFQWGLVPLTSTDAGLCRMVNCGVAQWEHPLRISLRCKKPESEFKHLVPSLLHTSMQRYGYPMKHPLAEQFGMTLLQPMRHRLRSGQDIRFMVYSMQAEVDSSHFAKLAQEATSQRRGVQGEVISEDGGKKPTSEELRHRIRSALKPCMRCGSCKGPARVVAVVGNWQRVQVLSRRLLSTDTSSRAEVHEGLVRLTSEECVKKSKDKEPFVRKDIPFEGAPMLGGTPRPNYWVLAEFQVDNTSTPLPYDEDRPPCATEEMLKPPPPPPDAIELIRNLEVGRAVKLDHQGGEEDLPQKAVSEGPAPNAA